MFNNRVLFFHFFKKDPKLFLEMAFFIMKMSFAKKFFSFEKVLEMARPKKIVKIKKKKEYKKNLETIATYFLRNSFFGKKTCYDFALVYFHFLNKAGFNAKLHYGINPQKIGKLAGAGHAWVAVNKEEFPRSLAGKKEQYLPVLSFSAQKKNC